MSKFCENCGTPLGDEDNFCPSCGTKSEAITEPVEETVTEPVSEETTEPAAEPTTEPAAQPTAEPISETEAESSEQTDTDPTEQPAADEKNLYNTPRSTDPGPFVAYAPNGTAPEPVPSGNTFSEAAVGVEPVKKSGKGVLIAILIVILVLLIGAGILIYFLFFSTGDCKESVEAYYEAQEDLKFEDFRKATGDTALISIVEDENSSDIETFKVGCQRMQKIYQATNIDVDIDYEILDMHKISKDKLSDYNENSLVAEKGYEVDVSYTVKDESTGEKENYSETLTVVKFDGDWCVTDIVDAIDDVIEIGELSDDEFETAIDFYNDN